MIGDIVAIMVAVAFAVPVISLVAPLRKLGAVFAQLECSIKELSDEAVVTVKQGQDSLDQVNNQLEQADSITSAVNRSAEDVPVLTTPVTATLGRPLIKVAVFSYVVRKAMGLNQEGQEEV